MTALEQPTIRRDRYGRYLIPDPVTGKERSWTRATTLADTLDDRYNLELWKLRTAATGLASRPDLLAMVAAHQGDKQQLNRVCEQALEAGKASEGANLGTALHALTEKVDRGEPAMILDALRPDVEAYRATMAASGFTIATLPDGRLAREVVVLCPELEVAGTADHILTRGLGLTIADLKTGASAIDWAMGSIAIQLAIYANATHYFDPATGVLAEMPDVDLETAIVIHLPVGSATCTLHEVDIAAGWEAAQRALWVRNWRKRKGLSEPLNIDVPPADDPFDGLENDKHHATIERTLPPRPAAPMDGPYTDVRSWLLARCGAIKTAGHGQAVLDRWPADTPGLKTTEPISDDQLAAIAAVCDAVEREHELPFFPVPPNLRVGWLTDLLQRAFPGAEEVPAENEGDPPAQADDSEPPSAVVAVSAGTPSSGDASTREGEATANAARASGSQPLSSSGDATSPDTPPDEGWPVTDQQVTDINATLADLDPARKTWATGIIRDMHTAGMPLKLREFPTLRRYCIAKAVIAWSQYTTNDNAEVVRLALERTVGFDIEPHELGAVFATLTLEQLDALETLRRDIDAGDVIPRAA